MTGVQLQQGRKEKSWTQQEAAMKLGVSQPYLALMENEQRRVPGKLARRAANLYGLSLTALPLEEDWNQTSQCSAKDLAAYLAGLGYPGFAYLKAVKKSRNPAEVLLMALSCEELESRLAEALPWVVFQYPDLDWRWLVPAVKTRDLQNRLGFVIVLARRLAQQQGNQKVVRLLEEQEAVLERARLVREETFCRQSLTNAERNWLRRNRPPEARHWNLLTDLSLDDLHYAK